MAAWTSKLNSAIARICEIVAECSGTDKVHDGLREFDDKASFMALFTEKATHRIHGWQVDRLGVPQETVDDGLHIRQHDLTIVGYYQVVDKQTGTSCASAPLWRDIVEQVCQGLRLDPQLGGLMQDSSCPVAPSDDRRELHELKLHYMDLRVSVFERIVLGG